MKNGINKLFQKRLNNPFGEIQNSEQRIHGPKKIKVRSGA